MNTRNLAISAGVGGVTMGLLSGIPLVNLGNCLLCLWVWVGGILGVFIYTRTEQAGLSNGDGAIIGALSGLVGALIVAGFSLIFGAGMLAMLSMLGQSSSDELLGSLAGQGIGLVASFAVNIVVYPGIGALAGLIGVQMFGKPTPSVGV